MESLITQSENKPALYDMFVRLKAAKMPSGKMVYNTSWSVATGKREFTYRGDKFTDHPAKQLVKLRSLMRRLMSEQSCAVIIIRDNQVRLSGAQDPDNYTIFKCVNGIVELDRLQDTINQLNLMYV